MPLFLDIHRHVEGLTPKAAADAHARDLEVQKKHGVDYKNYWFNEAEGTVICLCEAPTREAARAVHQEAHGLMPEEIIEVKAGS